MSKALVLGAATLVFSAAGALAADLMAPGYGYAAPVYVAPAHPIPAEPIYDYAPGYGYEYTAPGYWNRSYWGRGYGFEWR
jgi:hypothetical protein